MYIVAILRLHLTKTHEKANVDTLRKICNTFCQKEGEAAGGSGWFIATIIIVVQGTKGKNGAQKTPVEFLGAQCFDFARIFFHHHHKIIV